MSSAVEPKTVTSDNCSESRSEMPKVIEESLRRRLRVATYIFFAAFSLGTLSVLFGEDVISGVALGYVIRGSLLISVISGSYIAMVSAWNYALKSHD